MLATFTAATNDQPEVPEYVRQAGVADGVRVYFVVDPIFRHESYGAVVGYQMMVSADAGFNYIPGNYLIYPSVIGAFGQPQAYLSVVPDGVRTVRWHFTCSPYPPSSGCQLPAEKVVSVPGARQPCRPADHERGQRHRLSQREQSDLVSKQRLTHHLHEGEQRSPVPRRARAPSETDTWPDASLNMSGQELAVGGLNFSVC